MDNILVCGLRCMTCRIHKTYTCLYLNNFKIVLSCSDTYIAMSYDLNLVVYSKQERKNP